MSLSVLAILTIAVLGMVLWLMALPGVEEVAPPMPTVWFTKAGPSKATNAASPAET